MAIRCRRRRGLRCGKDGGLAKKILPDGISFEWTDLSYQKTTTSNVGRLIFPLSILSVYLVLAANSAWSA